MNKEKISQAEKRKMLFKKKEKLFKSYYEPAQFKEPVLILMRRNQNAEFFENATKGKFEFSHSDGETRYIYLTPKYLQSFPYGKKNFRGYICHEDFAIPLPAEPEITAETIGTVIDKTLNDIRNWKAQEYKAQGAMWFKIALGIVALIAAYTFYVMMTGNNVPVQPTPVINTIKNTSVQVLNQTPTILG